MASFSFEFDETERDGPADTFIEMHERVKMKRATVHLVERQVNWKNL